MTLSHCKSCGALIRWATTANGKAMPIDELPRTDGNLVVTRNAAGDGLEARMATKDTPTQSRFASHFSTCPGAAAHRKAKP